MLCVDMDKVLKRARSKGIETIPDLAVQAGLSEPTLYRLANGNEPSLPTVWRIARLLGARIESILLEVPTAPGAEADGAPHQRKRPAARRQRTSA